MNELKLCDGKKWALVSNTDLPSFLIFRNFKNVIFTSKDIPKLCLMGEAIAWQEVA